MAGRVSQDNNRWQRQIVTEGDTKYGTVWSGTVFQATVGVDDVQASRGSVSFAVYGDDVLLEETAALKGGGATHVFDVDILGVKELSLRAGDGGDGIGNDHGDWALARVTCGDGTEPSPEPTVTPTVEPTVTPTVSGRQWFTKCEPYSSTFRCWTSIWSTQVTHEGGKSFESRTRWFFNNLTYLPADRSLWAGNPLGHTKNWTAVDGCKWYTECDTATTGRNGCRSYLHANNVVEAKPKAGGGFTYVLVNKWVFNIVLFK